MTNDSARISVEVTCFDPDGAAVRHRVGVLADGSIEASDHKGEAWAEAEAVAVALGDGTPLRQPCLFLARDPEVTPPRLRDMRFEDWHVTTDGEVTGAARRALFTALQLDLGTSHYLRADAAAVVRCLGRVITAAPDLMESSPGPDVAALSEGDRFGDDLLVVASAGCTLRQAIDLLDEGFNADQAQRIVSALNRTPDFQNGNEWFGGYMQTVERLLDLGIPAHRIPAYLENRHAAIGPPEAMHDAQGIKDAAGDRLLAEVAGTPGDRADWLAEVVASIPSARSAIQYYSTGDMREAAAQAHRWNIFSRAALELILDVAIDRLRRGIDPQDWHDDWMLPSAEAIIVRAQALEAAE